METQEKVFAYQVTLSSAVKLPLIIHERQAFSQVMAILTQYGMRNMKLHLESFGNYYDTFPKRHVWSYSEMTKWPSAPGNIQTASNSMYSAWIWLSVHFKVTPVRSHQSFRMFGQVEREDCVKYIVKSCNNNFVKMYCQRLSQQKPKIVAMLARHNVEEKWSDVECKFVVK